MRAESPQHACFSLPPVCHCVLEVKQALEQITNPAPVGAAPVGLKYFLGKIS